MGPRSEIAQRDLNGTAACTDSDADLGNGRSRIPLGHQGLFGNGAQLVDRLLEGQAVQILDLWPQELVLEKTEHCYQVA